ncbi:MAG: mitochondrial fission ELM1 family protein [Alphaproteobacteria bacterium]
MSDGTAGMENQALGLAQILGFPTRVKRLKTRPPWRWLPPSLWPCPLAAQTRGGDRLEPPWPDVLIATGRQSVAPALAIKARNGGRTFTIQIQNPGISCSRFDLVVAPLHDQLTGPNVIATTGSLHSITPAKLAEAARRLGPALAHLKRPLVAVLVGGTNKVFRLSAQHTRRLAEGLASLVKRHGAGLAVTPSRRTGAVNETVLRDMLGPLGAEIWDGKGENPYLGYLGLADAIVVTGDSVNMVSEACATGKPVYVFDLEGGSAKFSRFHEKLRSDGLTRPFEGTLSEWSYRPLDDTARVVAIIKERLANWRQSASTP